MKYVLLLYQVVLLKTWRLHKETSEKNLKCEPQHKLDTNLLSRINEEFRYLSIPLDLSSFVNLEFFRFVFWPMMTWTSRGYKNFILNSSQNIETQLENLYTYCEATAFLYASGFCDQILPSLQVYWKNLHLTISFKLLRVSHVLGFVQREEVSTKSRPIRDWRKDSTVGKYFGID